MIKIFSDLRKWLQDSHLPTDHVVIHITFPDGDARALAGKVLAMDVEDIKRSKSSCCPPIYSGSIYGLRFELTARHDEQEGAQ